MLDTRARKSGASDRKYGYSASSYNHGLGIYDHSREYAQRFSAWVVVRGSEIALVIVCVPRG